MTPTKDPMSHRDIEDTVEPRRVLAALGYPEAGEPLRASGQCLEVRLLEPATVRNVKFSGAVERPRWRQTRRAAVIDLALRGRATVDARL